jgi:uncharacterized protein YndB with AHSA1/START domain
MARGGYTPGPASGAQIQKDGEKWTLILVRELRHPPEKVWQALTEPAHLREWAPFDADENLGAAGKVNLTWVATGRTTEARVTQAEPPRLLECGDMRWELEPLGPAAGNSDAVAGTRLRLWHRIDSRFIAWGAAGWHICFDVLDRLLNGRPMGRLIGAAAAQNSGWQRLSAEYAEQLGVKNPGSQARIPGNPD